MAGTVTRMSKIKQLLQLYKRGTSNRKIASLIGLNRNTVNEYIRKIKLHGFDIGELLKLEDPVLERKLSAGSPAYLEERFQDLKGELPYLEKELNCEHVTRYLLWQEYKGKYPNGYGYSQFCHHLSQQLVARHPSAILEHALGEKLFVDFAGDKLSYVDRDTGEEVDVQVFVACLPASDYAFCMAVPSQTTDDFLYALSTCLETLGGVPKVLVPDNLKAAVIKADRHEPELNRVMEDFANHYGFVVCPARVRKPQDKALVENQVKLIYHRVYARIRNEMFFSIEELNKALFEKTREHNQTRMQQRPYSREERFLAEEKPLLKELPREPFQLTYYTSLRVAKNNCIYLGRDKHYYSVPYTYIGEQTEVIYTRTLVKIYQRGMLIATHRRTVGFGYTTINEHLCSTHQHYKDRSPEYYIKTAKRRSSTLAEIIEKLFEEADIPEVVFKRCDGLLSLQRKTDPIVFEKACILALEHRVYSYKFVKNTIENKTYEKTNERKQSPLPEHMNIRGRDYFV